MFKLQKWRKKVSGQSTKHLPELFDPEVTGKSWDWCTLGGDIPPNFKERKGLCGKMLGL